MCMVQIGQQAIEVEWGTPLLKLAEMFKNTCQYPILLAEVNHELQELHKKVLENCHVKFLDIRDVNGFRVYQRSVTFLMIYAAKQVLGKKTRIVIEHSIEKNYYGEIKENNITTTPQLLTQIEEVMHQIVAKNMPILKHSLPLEEGLKLAEEFGLYDKVQFLKYRRTSSVNFYQLDWFYDYFYGAMAPSTGCLPKFSLKQQDKGFMLIFPSSTSPDTLVCPKPFKKITQVFNESNQWARIMKTETVGALNDKICSGHRGDIIRINEALHEKRIANLADHLFKENKHIVLIAGPSSSGKTTFAHRLSIQLRVNGQNPHVLSLDNYYRGREFVPKDEHGKLDFEALEAIDVELFNRHLEQLVAGEQVELPHFNFISDKREYKGHFLQLKDDDVLIIEGIHALNEALSAYISRSKKFKIFISALTQLNIDDHNRIPTSDTRCIRRMVRDSQFRGLSATTTLQMWPSVMRGERQNIFPFQEEADAFFNSALVYELCVLKQFAEPLLFGISKTQKEYAEARRLVKFLDCFIGVPSEEVPNNSILREFIGGGCFRT